MQAAEDAREGILLAETTAMVDGPRCKQLLGSLYSLQGQAWLAEPGHSARNPSAAVQVLLMLAGRVALASAA